MPRASRYGKEFVASRRTFGGRPANAENVAPVAFVGEVVERFLIHWRSAAGDALRMFEPIGQAVQAVRASRANIILPSPSGEAAYALVTAVFAARRESMQMFRNTRLIEHRFATIVHKGVGVYRSLIAHAQRTD